MHACVSVNFVIIESVKQVGHACTEVHPYCTFLRNTEARLVCLILSVARF